jgi:hypothetical protein
LPVKVNRERKIKITDEIYRENFNSLISYK